MNNFVKYQNWVDNVIQPTMVRINTELETYIRTVVEQVADRGIIAMGYFLANYARWNQPFNGACTVLAGQWSLQGHKELATVYTEDNVCLTSRVNSELIMSVTDEIGLGEYSNSPHQELSEVFAEKVMYFAELQEKGFVSDGRLGFTNQTVIAREEIASNYISELTLGLGFHIASEWCASIEFRVITEVVTERFPELVDYLTAQVISDQPKDKPVMEWLTDHIEVEVEHFQHAKNAAAYMIAGVADTDIDLTALAILRGMDNFLTNQKYFFSQFE